MDELRTEHPEEINVLFLNILKPKNQDLMKYYGIASIPTQVLLNKSGEEFFRHSGYISTNKLLEKMNNYGSNLQNYVHMYGDGTWDDVENIDCFAVFEFED